MLKSKGSKNSKSDELLGINNVNDIEMQLDSIDMADNVIHEEHQMSNVDLNDSHTISHNIDSIDNADDSQSKLRKISKLIDAKLKSSKMKKGGFEKISDEDNSDKDDIITPNNNNNANITIQTNTTLIAVNQNFDVNICHTTCHCTKTKTIICLLTILLFFLVFFMVILVQTFRKSEHTNNDNTLLNCMNGRKVLIISLDGFRAEYLNRINTPNIDTYFIEQGVSVSSLKPVFPSKTFPNHYSIVTGLYPPTHGIIANHFYDPILNKTFDIQYQANDSLGEWFKGEPIWNTIKQKNLTSAALQYPGSAANCNGRIINGKDLSGYPTYYIPHYHYDWPFQTRINLTLNLLRNNNVNNTNYDLILLYFEQPDHHGHVFGPDSINTSKMVQQMDSYIGYLMQQMETYNVLNNTDVILLSDHGMTNIEKYDADTYLNEGSQIIVVNTSLFPFDEVIIRDWSPIMGVYLKQNSEILDNNVTYAMNLMSDAIIHNRDKCKIYPNGQIPYRTYNNVNDYNNRVPDFIVDSELGYMIYVEGHSVPNMLGTHGFNNSKYDMHGIFMARGPSFKHGHVIHDKYLENIHLYEMFCNLLCDVEPNENNGTSGIYSQQLFKV